MMKPQPNDRTHILSYQTFAPTKEKPPNFEANIQKKKKKIKIKINHSTIDTLNTITISYIYISLNNIKFTKEKKSEKIK